MSASSACNNAVISPSVRYRSRKKRDGNRQFVSYLRVSTDKQGRSGLGLEAQREAVSSYLNGGKWVVAKEYVETESGKHTDRPKLKAALAYAKAIGATVVFAKLDRLTRNVDLLRSLVASSVDFVFCDLPHVPPGAMGRFFSPRWLRGRARGRAYQRAHQGCLAAAKRRGVKLGNPNGARALRGKQVGNDAAVERIKANALERAENLKAIVEDIRAQGIISVRAVAAELNRRGILTARGGDWHLRLRRGYWSALRANGDCMGDCGSPRLAHPAPYPGASAKGVTALRAIADALNARGITTPRGGMWHASSVRNALARA